MSSGAAPSGQKSTRLTTSKPAVSAPISRWPTPLAVKTPAALWGSLEIRRVIGPVVEREDVRHQADIGGHENRQPSGALRQAVAEREDGAEQWRPLEHQNFGQAETGEVAGQEGAGCVWMVRRKIADKFTTGTVLMAGRAARRFGRPFYVPRGPTLARSTMSSRRRERIEGILMSMDVGGGGKDSLKADINVTPLVDVMLVLLIIMMLIAPMLRQVAVQMPEAANTGEKPENQDQTVVAIDSRGAFSSIYCRSARQSDPAGPARPRGQEGKDRLSQG